VHWNGPGLTPATYVLRGGAVWAVAAFRTLRPEEGHVSADHLVLAHSGRLSSDHRGLHTRRCQLVPEEWFSHPEEGTLVRIHSECLLSETFGFQTCDCREQLIGTMDRIEADGEGLIVYLRQEGRGIGLTAKLRVLSGDPSLDTFERNRDAGYPDDMRTYGTAVEIVLRFGLRHIRLVSDSPLKSAAFREAGVHVREQVRLQYRLTPDAARELLAKKRRGYSVELTEEALERIGRQSIREGET
jgi:GTP cyclohydrolase II